MAQKNSLNLKSKLNGNGTELDLSLSELSSVPVKEIAQLKKVHFLDLSSNKLKVLPEDFGILTNLVRIDLSQNFLTSLPDSFGQLVQLQHLDLYKNQLKELPFSLGRLKKLQFLDIKDNPLSDDLKGVAGDCLDAKQCKSAAVKLVQYLSDLEDRRVKLEKQQKDKETKARVLAEEAELERKREEKKKDKDIRRKQNSRAVASETEPERFPHRVAEKPKSQAGPAGKKDGKTVRDNFVPPRRSWISLCCQAIMTVLITTGIVGLMGMMFIPQLCQPSRGAEQKWGGTQVFCEQVDTLIRMVQLRLEGSPLEPLVGIVAEGLISAGKWCGTQLQNWDLKWIVDTVAIWGVEFLEWCGVAQKWIADHGWEYLTDVRAIFTTVCTVIYNVTYDLFMWLADFFAHVINNWPEVWEKIKFYWTNVK